CPLVEPNGHFKPQYCLARTWRSNDMQKPIREVLFQFVKHSLLVSSRTVFEFYVFMVRYQCICNFYALEGFANNRRRKIALFVKIFAVKMGVLEFCFLTE